MNRIEFISNLRFNLQGTNSSEVEDILSDYEEHFDIGLSKGKTEEEISKELGDPKDIAKSYRSTYDTPYNERTDRDINRDINREPTNNILMILLVIFVNLVVVLGPYFAILGVILSFFVAGLSIAFSGVALMFGIPFNFIHYISNPSLLTSISFGIGLLALGILGVILTIFLAKWFYGLTIKYIKWNISIIEKGGF